MEWIRIFLGHPVLQFTLYGKRYLTKKISHPISLCREVYNMPQHPVDEMRKLFEVSEYHSITNRYTCGLLILIKYILKREPGVIERMLRDYKRLQIARSAPVRNILW